MKLRPYPEYKDSSVPWLGKMPEHWDVKRNKLFLREVNERSEDGSEELLTVSQYTGITRRRERLSEEGELLTNAASLVGYKRVSPGDLVMNIMLAWNGSLGVSSIKGITSPAYCVFRTKGDVEPRFLHYLLRTPLFTGAFKTVSTGVVDSRLRLYPDVFFRLPSPLPLRDEQATIVRFLDYFDRRINHLIRAKRRLIELLNEQKQAIIHRAVTRGLDPNVRLKPSGLEWLGDVPEHWEVIRLGRLIQLTTGFPFSSQGFSLREGDTRLLRGINVSPGTIRWDSVVRWPSSQIDAYSSFALRVGDVVLGMDRPIVGGGIRVAVIEEQDIPSLLLQRVARLRPLEHLDNSYMVLLVTGRGFSDYLDPIFTGISVPHISPEQMRSFRVALPSLDEQAAIVAWVRSNTDSIERAINRAHREIDLLHEYRTRLIANVVTGKLDVRGVIEAGNGPSSSSGPYPGLPDEAEELDDLDAGEDAEAEEIIDTEETT